MGLFGFLFGKAGETPVPSPSPDGVVHWGNGGLQYDPELISKLVQEHRHLLSLFEAVAGCYQAQDFDRVQKALQEFKLALNVHLLTENVRFYAYVKKGLSNNMQDFETVTAFWREMQGIAKVVIQFLGKYETSNFTPEMRVTFGKELEDVGAALASRIKREEESLYTLYQPSY